MKNDVYLGIAYLLYLKMSDCQVHNLIQKVRTIISLHVGRGFVIVLCILLIILYANVLEEKRNNLLVSGGDKH